MEPMKGWFSSVADERPVAPPTLWPLWVALAVGAVLVAVAVLVG